MGRDTNTSGKASKMSESRGLLEGLKRYHHLGHYSSSACFLISPQIALTSDQVRSQSYPCNLTLDGLQLHFHRLCPFTGWSSLALDIGVHQQDDPDFLQPQHTRISRCSHLTEIFSSSCQEPHPYTDHHNPQKHSL